MNLSIPKALLAVLALAPLALLALVAFQSPKQPAVSLALPAPRDFPHAADMVRLPGGEFTMGSDFGGPECRPAHAVVLRPFWLDRHEVTNRQFAHFVAATGYETFAERAGSGWVFHEQSAQWRRMAGADWRHPDGPYSSIDQQPTLPVVQVSWHDAQAYARWAGKRLPSEAEWEYAARGGLAEADYPWGREPRPGGRSLANTRQGPPRGRDAGLDGFRGRAPVGSYPPSAFDLLDISGNVWQWCSDWYSGDYYSASRLHDPAGPATGDKRVHRGGSWLSADPGGAGPKVWQRGAAAPDASFNHVGFRCARDDGP